jgi:hypothetical protein
LVPAPAGDQKPANARAAKPPGRPWDILGAAEVCAGVLLTALVVYLHWVFRSHAGGLWRDEVNTVHMATLPAFSQTWDFLQFDSFPILIFPIIRGWVAMFSGDDASLRTFGLLIGLAIFGALWLNARLFGHRIPLLALALLGCNPEFIRYADSLRAYGIGMLLLLLTFSAVWRVVESLRPGRFAVAAILAVLSVQALYYNSVLLLSICVAGALASAWERDWKKAFCVLLIGLPAALSLIPYANTIRRMGAWNFLVHFDITFAWIWKKLSDVTGSPDPVGVWIWASLFFGALALVVWQLWRRRPPLFAAGGSCLPQARLTLFATGTLVIGTVCYALFLDALQYFTQPWYYITYLALAGAALDVIYGAALLSRPPYVDRWRMARLAFIWGFCALMFMQARSDLFRRQTNLDLVAGRLSALTSKGDLVVNNRWECAITFAHYYRGPAQVMTSPPISDHRLHRYDLVLEQMLIPNAMQPVLAAVEETLRAGHRVWLVGDPIILADGADISSMDPAAGVNVGRHGSTNYYAFWAMEVSETLVHHAALFTRVSVPTPGPISRFENEPVAVFVGWH